MNLYVIIPTIAITQAMLNNAVCRSLPCARKTNCGTNTILEFKEEHSKYFENYAFFSYEEILQELQGAGWQIEI